MIRQGDVRRFALDHGGVKISIRQHLFPDQQLIELLERLVGQFLSVRSLYGVIIHRRVLGAALLVYRAAEGERVLLAPYIKRELLHIVDRNQHDKLFAQRDGGGFHPLGDPVIGNSVHHISAVEHHIPVAILILSSGQQFICTVLVRIDHAGYRIQQPIFLQVLVRGGETHYTSGRDTDQILLQGGHRVIVSAAGKGLPHTEGGDVTLTLLRNNDHFAVFIDNLNIREDNGVVLTGINGYNLRSTEIHPSLLQILTAVPHIDFSIYQQVVPAARGGRITNRVGERRGSVTESGGHLNHRVFQPKFIQIVVRRIADQLLRRYSIAVLSRRIHRRSENRVYIRIQSFDFKGRILFILLFGGILLHIPNGKRIRLVHNVNVIDIAGLFIQQRDRLLFLRGFGGRDAALLFLSLLGRGNQGQNQNRSPHHDQNQQGNQQVFLRFGQRLFILLAHRITGASSSAKSQHPQSAEQPAGQW